MKSEPKIKTSIYLPESVHWELKNEALKRRISDTTAMQQAIELWLAHEDQYGDLTDAQRNTLNRCAELIRLGADLFSDSKKRHKDLTFRDKEKPHPVIDSLNPNSPATNVGISEEFEPWLSQLCHILRTNNPYAAPSIKKNLEAFVRLSDLDGGAHAPPPGESAEDEAKRALKQLERAKGDAEEYLNRRRRRPTGSD